MKPIRRISAIVALDLLRELLSDKLSWRQMLRAARPFDPAASTDVLLGFVPHVDHPAEILITFAPVRGVMMPVAELTYRNGRWAAELRMVSTRWLIEREVVAIEKVDWLFALGNLARDLRGRSNWQNVDLTPWAIATSWPYWETGKMSWERRAQDLAKGIGTNPLTRNTLAVKCRRMGLTRK